MKLTGHNRFFAGHLLDEFLTCASLIKCACISMITDNYSEENAYFLGENNEKKLYKQNIFTS